MYSYQLRFYIYRYLSLPIVQSHDSFWVETFHHYYVEVGDDKKGRDDLLFYVKLDSKQVQYHLFKCEQNVYNSISIYDNSVQYYPCPP